MELTRRNLKIRSPILVTDPAKYDSDTISCRIFFAIQDQFSYQFLLFMFGKQYTCIYLGNSLFRAENISIKKPRDCVQTLINEKDVELWNLKYKNVDGSNTQKFQN